MPLLARKVNGTLWANNADDTLWAEPEFPLALLPELVDRQGGGLSFWQVDGLGHPSLKRIAAALLAVPTTKEITGIEFRLVDKAQVEALGISITQTDGGTKDKGINHLHYEFGDLTGTRAVALLRLMKQKAKIFPGKVTARLIAQGIIRKNIPKDVLTKDFLNALNQQKAVKIILPKK
jgi:hypothetical protein